MHRSKSSQRWLDEHFNDIYVKKAHAEGYRSRAVYKLQEMAQKDQIFKPGMHVLDLGAAPGGWSQYVAQQLQGRGKVIASDLLPMEPIAGVDMVIGDFTEDDVLKQIQDRVPQQGVDVLLSDMAPNMSGHVTVDMLRAMYLVELVLDCASSLLKPQGTLLMKVFHGSGFDEMVKNTRTRFDRVVIRKPLASRSRSRETYLLARGFRGI